MRVCTLIVRLVGLAMLIYSAIALVEILNFNQHLRSQGEAFSRAGAGHMVMTVRGASDRMFWYAVGGVVIGAVMAISAPPITWLLTYDTWLEDARSAD